jgi:ribosome modulation factor
MTMNEGASSGAMPSLPPPVGPRGLALRAMVEGRAAGQSGADVRTCPYTSARPFTRRAWLTGYAHGRREAGLELPATDVDHDAPWPGDLD